MAKLLIPVNVASAALLASITLTVAARGPIVSTPEFAVGGTVHRTQKGRYHHLRYPAQFHALPAEGPAPAEVKKVEHADASHDEHSGKPGEGGDPMVPRTHEHGDVKAEHNYGWSYQAPEDWARSYGKCDDKKQSPIDLPSQVRKAKDAGNGNMSALVSYKALSDLHIDNTGHGLQVNGKLGNLTLSSGVYQAAQFNFHFPSEHEVDGNRTAGEIQIVHQKLGADGTNSMVILAILLDEAEDEDVDMSLHLLMQKLGFPVSDALKVLIANTNTDDKLTNEEQLEEAVESEEKEKKEEEQDEKSAEAKQEEEKTHETKEATKKKGEGEAAASFVQMTGDPPSAPAGAPGAAPAVPFAPAPAPVPQLPEEDQSLPIEGEIDLGKTFASEFEGGYYHYKGSLTTPPCSETVEWFVLDRHGSVTPAMVKAFKKLFPDPANSRPIQPLNNRDIVWSKEEMPEELPARSSGKRLSAGLWLSSIGFVVASSL